MIIGSLADAAAAPADVAIVGAGTAGLFLARELARRGRSVMVLEAGGAAPTTAPNRVTSAQLGRTHRGIFEGRAIGLGGTSTLWGGQLAEFDPADFDRAYAPWPFGLDELVPWYARVHAALGLEPRETDAIYRAALGGDEGQGGEIERFFTCWLPEPNFARLFRSDITRDSRIRIALDTSVTGFAFAGARVEAAIARQAGSLVRVRAGCFVLATGTIAANRLMLTEAQRGGVPWGSGAIGTMFQDHLAGPVATVELLDERRFRERFENARVGRIKLQPKLRRTRVARDALGSAQIGLAGAFNFRSDLGEHLANLKHVARSMGSAASLSTFASLPRDLMAVGRMFAPFALRYVRDRRVMAFFDSALEFAIQSEQLPIASSRIVLMDGPPAPDGLPRAGVDWQVDGAEVAAIRDFTLAAGNWLDRQGIARLVLDPGLAAADRGFIDRLTDNNHPCGGLAMSHDPRCGVVDPNLRVHGADNLFVASAAVYPSSGHANCTLTLLALAARLAAHLAPSGRGE